MIRSIQPTFMNNVPPYIGTNGCYNIVWDTTTVKYYHHNGIFMEDVFSSVTPPPTASTISIHDNLDILTSTLIADGGTESWRQYVPLAVSFAVILDILLGSPFVKLISSIALGGGNKNVESSSMEEMDQENNVGGRERQQQQIGGSVNRRPERVDSKKIAEEAIQKARYTLELKQFLEDNKTDQDRYEEIRKQIDKQINELDTKNQNIRG